jgi:hypothetical protein
MGRSESAQGSGVVMPRRRSNWKELCELVGAMDEARQYGEKSGNLIFSHIFNSSKGTFKNLQTSGPEEVIQIPSKPSSQIGRVCVQSLDKQSHSMVRHIPS